MAKFSLLSLCFLLVLHGSVAEFQLSLGRDQYHQHPPQPRYRDRNECRLENLNALEPAYRVKSEGGEIEYWDRNNEQLKCAGVAFRRVVIEPKGLFLPEYINGHRASYVVKGRGLEGVAIPGCPETYQSFQQQSQQSESQERYGDQHQKVRRLDRGDILAIPNGVPQWVYNNGDDQLVIVTLIDISNDDNQLDGNLREFFLAGNPQRSQQSQSQAQHEQFSQRNIFSQFRSKLLAESFQIKEETANKLKGEKDNRGPIIKVKEGLQVIMPPTQQREEEQQQQRQDKANFLDENLCNMRLKVNIEDPRHAESYNPRGGRVSRFNGQDHPIFNYLQLNVVRGVLYKNAILSPHYDSSHSLIYVTRGSAEVQIVGNFDKPVYNGELREGQLLSVPQNFVVLKKAGNNGFEWVAFKTNDNVRVSSLAGSDSAIRGMPEEVLMNSYQISREEARNLKYNNNERMVFSPRSRSQGVAFA